MAELELDLPDDVIAFIDDQIASGLYLDAGDYIRDLLREDMRGHKRLWDEIDKGFASPRSEFAPEEAIDRARERVRSRAA